MKSIYITLITSSLIIGSSFAQQAKAWNNWHFGWFASMQFTSGSPVGTTGSVMISEEGSASYSDENGNLLFYTNGGRGDGGNIPPGGVWNRNHQMMPNGSLDNLAGCSSSPQSALVIPKSGSATQYYLYTMGCGSLQVGLRESIIDMSLDGGLGDLTQVGTQISTMPSLAEGLTATKHANGTDYWIVIHSNGNEFYVYPHTAAGIGSPVTYTVGSYDSYGQIKINATGTVLACGTEVFDFNNATGAITNPRSTGRSAWGRSFSPSGRYLYVSGALGSGNLYQYDLQAPNLAASEVLIAGNSLFAGPMQLGPDGKIYVAVYSHAAVSVINSPESAGAACNFVLDQVTLNNNCQLGLPNYIDSYYLELRVGIEEQAFSFGVYPNPASENVTVTASVKLDEITIMTIDGKLLQTIIPTEISTAIEAGKLSPGTYFITGTAQGVKSVKELVID
jgi:Secretion system C-terminal sorting domain